MPPAAQLRALRRHLGLSRAQMAEALGIAERYLERLEQGGRPTSRRTLLAARHVAVMAWLREAEIPIPDDLVFLLCDPPPEDDAEYGP